MPGQNWSWINFIFFYSFIAQPQQTVSHRSCCKAPVLDSQLIRRNRIIPQAFRTTMTGEKIKKERKKKKRDSNNDAMHSGSVWLWTIHLEMCVFASNARNCSMSPVWHRNTASWQHFPKATEVRLKPSGGCKWKNQGSQLVYYLYRQELWETTLPWAWSCSHPIGCTGSLSLVPLESFRESEETANTQTHVLQWF